MNWSTVPRTLLCNSTYQGYCLFFSCQDIRMDILVVKCSTFWINLTFELFSLIENNELKCCFSFTIALPFPFVTAVIITKLIKMPKAPGVARWSPIQVLTRPNNAKLQWSDDNWCIQCGMAIARERYEICLSRDAITEKWCSHRWFHGCFFPPGFVTVAAVAKQLLLDTKICYEVALLINFKQRNLQGLLKIVHVFQYIHSKMFVSDIFLF